MVVNATKAVTFASKLAASRTIHFAKGIPMRCQPKSDYQQKMSHWSQEDVILRTWLFLSYVVALQELQPPSESWV